MVLLLKENFIVKDPGSAFTHFIGMILSLFVSIFLLLKTVKQNNLISLISIIVFSLSLILLYTASTVYHTFDLTDKINKRLQKFDHMMIYLLIAGTYTPLCLIALKGTVGYIMLAIIWTMAFIGIAKTAFVTNFPKWVSALIYIIMGWTCIFAFRPLSAILPLGGILWLLIGGIIYTIGGIIYALHLPIFNTKHPNFGSHEIFHLFCLAGSACHVIVIYQYVLNI